MQDTLEPYYGGNHKAHAERIFNAHIKGGIDRIGFSSFEQMLQRESWEKIAPELNSKKEVSSLLKQIYPSHKEKLGVVVFEFSRPSNI
jgi:ASC-1-like (ASCH) protein